MQRARQIKPRKINLDELDRGIRRYVEIIRDAGVFTLSSCQGRDKPGYRPERDGEHHGDFPYIIFTGTSSDAFIALAAAMREGLPVRSIEQAWFVYPEDKQTPIGPDWRITFWKKDSGE